MADEPVTKSASPAPDESTAAVDSNKLETTTAHDSSIPVNQSETQTSAPVPEAAPTEPAELPPTATTDSPKSETPITVTESEVNSTPAAAEEGLADEVEALSGEIQALEAKIDRLTGNVNPVGEVKANPVPASPASNKQDDTTLVNRPAPVAPVVPAPVSPKVSQPVTDIYSKVGSADRTPEAPAPTPPNDAEEVETSSGIGLIGEVLTVFGILILFAMGASPFFKSAFADSLWEAIRSIAWPAAAASLGLGFVLSLFSKGKIVLKIFTFILFLVATVMYLGVAGYGSLLGPLNDPLESLLEFYR